MCRYVLALTLLSLAAFGQGNQRGSIDGLVVDENGSPVANANVWFHQVVAGKKPTQKALPFAVTGNDGRFSITNLELGTYGVNPWKDEDGYPNRAFAIYSSGPDIDPMFEVTLTSQAPVADNVTLVLGQNWESFKAQ